MGDCFMGFKHLNCDNAKPIPVRIPIWFSQLVIMSLQNGYFWVSKDYSETCVKDHL